jgi:4-amino-4-deoxy-L-arabinose transferase-like glycosyltransferase
MAVAPAVYYSRYFIQETLLVAFTLGAFACALRWWRTGAVIWAVLGGIAVGLMQATKATAPLFLVLGAAAALSCVAHQRDGNAQTSARSRRALGFGSSRADGGRILHLVRFPFLRTR